MSNLSVTEFVRLGRDESGYTLPAGELGNHTSQNVSFTTSSAQSSAFQTDTRFIRVVSDTDCRIEVGTNPTASSTTILLPAGDVEYFGVNKGQSYKIAVIQ